MSARGISSRASASTPAISAISGMRSAVAPTPFAAFSLSTVRQHFLYFFPLPQGQGSLRPTPRTGFLTGEGFSRS